MENDLWDETKYIFRSENSEGKVILVKFQAVTVQEMVAHFQEFLTGCGFVLKGNLTVDEEAPSPWDVV